MVVALTGTLHDAFLEVDGKWKRWARDRPLARTLMQNLLRQWSRRHSTAGAGVLRPWSGPGSSTNTSKSIFDDDRQIDLSEDNDAVNGVRPGTAPVHRRRPPKQSTPSEYARHRQTMKQSFPDGWNPPRKLSREAMDGLRELYRYDPEAFATPVLAEKFRISPEAVRRILKGKWEPSKQRKTEMLEKERQAKAEYVKLSRERENLELQENLEARRRERQERTGKPLGIDDKDRFTFG